jgi:hypothetical protein
MSFRTCGVGCVKGQVRNLIRHALSTVHLYRFLLAAILKNVISNLRMGGVLGVQVRNLIRHACFTSCIFNRALV